MRNDKRLSWMLIAVFALLGTGIISPYGLSYLSSLEEKGIAVRAANASEIWDMEGAFDEALWAETDESGISIKNISHKDLWIFFEYQGDLKQVLKQSGPMLVLSGESVQVVLEPLDDKDSPRILNPLEIIEFDCVQGNAGCENLNCQSKSNGNCDSDCCSDWQWREFTGTIQFHTLNCYATLETAEIVISGETLWEMFFDRKFDTTPGEYYSGGYCKCEGKQFKAQNQAKYQLQGDQLKNTAQDRLEAGKGYLSALAEYKPINFLQQVSAAVDKIAPGLWSEHDYLQNELYLAGCKLDEALNIIDNYIAEQNYLQGIIYEQMQTIDNLKSTVNDMESEAEQQESINIGEPSPAGAETEPLGGDEEPLQTDLAGENDPTADGLAPSDETGDETGANESADEQSSDEEADENPSPADQNEQPGDEAGDEQNVDELPEEPETDENDNSENDDPNNTEDNSAQDETEEAAAD